MFNTGNHINIAANVKIKHSILNDGGIPIRIMCINGIPIISIPAMNMTSKI